MESDASVLKLLHQRLGEKWPRQVRPNVSDAPVQGFVIGVTVPKYSPPTVSAFTRAHPEISRRIVAWIRRSVPDAVFSSVQVNRNYAAKRHTDANNVGPSWIHSIGRHTGGKLWTEDRGVLDPKRRWALFDGNFQHETLPFSGERISFIAFTSRAYNRLQPPAVSELRAGYGINAAFSNFEEHPMLRGLAPMTQLVNVEEVKRRDAMFDSEDSNAFVAFSTGYNVGRGKAMLRLPGNYTWEGEIPPFAGLHKMNGASRIIVAPNRTGLICFVCNPTERTVLPKRFYLYHNNEVEGQKMARWLETIPSNAVVFITVSDTAVKKSDGVLPAALMGKLTQMFGPIPPVRYRAPIAAIKLPGGGKWVTGTPSEVVRLEANREGFHEFRDLLSRASASAEP